jgi:hypothetical protein
MNNAIATKYVAINPENGLHLREATQAEINAFRAANPNRVWEKATRVGEVLVDTYNGPGIWFGGAGF